MRFELESKEFKLGKEDVEKAKAIVALVKEYNSQLADKSIRQQKPEFEAFEIAKQRFFYECCKKFEISTYDYPAWGLSDDGKKLIAYRYVFND